MQLEGVFFKTSDFELTDTKNGESTFESVYLAQNVKNGQKYTAKILISGKEFGSEQQLNLLQQYLILHNLKHPSIVNYQSINFQSLILNPKKKKVEPTI